MNMKIKERYLKSPNETYGDEKELLWKNTLNVVNSRLDIAEGKSSELKDTVIATIQNNSQRG